MPLLNLSVRGIDGLVRRLRPGAVAAVAGVTAGSARLLAPVGRVNLAHMAVWIAFFATMTALGRTDGRHPGDALPFWEEACAEGRPTACERLVSIESTYCRDNSAWACNELGIHYRTGRVVEADAELGAEYFARACELRFQPACLNLLAPDRALRTDPRTLDLRLLLREGGLNLMEMPESELLARACEHAWGFACDRLAAAS